MRKPPTTRKNCGTLTGRGEHYQNGEEMCEPCRARYVEYQAEYYRRYTAGFRYVSVKELVVDVLETWFGRRFTIDNLLDTIQEIRPKTHRETVERALRALVAEGRAHRAPDPFAEEDAWSVDARSRRFVYWIPERAYLWESEDVG